MTSNDIREAFLRYFESQGHRRVPSAPLVPFGDASLLFVNSGMVPFKDVFVGADQRPYTTATSAQKCLRVSGKHNDLDTVGRTARHHTFFEMLGNFSFGDYFKREAIAYAWELMTTVYGVDPGRLWITVFETDDEARQLWISEAGVAPDRIVGLGEKDNFWAMGDTGPCGPCSELHIDRGAEFACGPDCGLGQCDCDRWLELYNLVFMQYNRAPDGNLNPLLKPSVDTGMGLERMASVLQGVASNWETDLFVPVLEAIARRSGVPYRPGDEGFPHRVIADHVRAATFLIADGVIPGNEGRGYVLRRIMRRAIRFGLKLGIDAPFLHELSGVVVPIMQAQYPELVDRQTFIAQAIKAEEDRFRQTLAVGLNLLDEAFGAQQAADTVIPGETVFKLYDTYGFPRELTEEVASERGVGIDLEGFDRLMARQRTQARERGRFKAAGTSANLFATLPLERTQFSGYESLHCEAQVVAIAIDGVGADLASEGDAVQVVLDRTVFYAEGGGQVGDAGTLIAPDGRITVSDTHRLPGDIIVHSGRVIAGEIQIGSRLIAEVDPERRLDVARNHSATHLLHAALRQVLGSHVQQAGSLVAPDRLRFDFSHLQAVTQDELRQVETMTNAQVLRNLQVVTNVMDFEEAMRAGALAFFGDKYDDEVRVVTMTSTADAAPLEHYLRDLPRDDASFSVELCGGTHVADTSQIGPVRIVSESSIGAGIRRIEAISGAVAQDTIAQRLDTVDRLVRQLQTPAEGLTERVRELTHDLAAERRQVATLQREAAKSSAGDLLSRRERVGELDLIRAVVPDTSGDGLRTIANDLRSRMDTGAVALASVVQGRPLFVVALTNEAVRTGLHAGNLVRELATIAGGSGGGRPDFGQAGGRDPEKVGDALEALPGLLQAR